MKRILCYVLIPLLGMLTSCQKNQPKESKDMTKLTFTEEQASSMSAIACLEAQGDLERLEEAINKGLDSGLTISQIKEALSQLYAYTGFPRSLNALGVLSEVIDHRNIDSVSISTLEGQDATALPDNFNALEEGTKVQTMLTGKPFNYSFAPATDYYLKAHLFGDIFARDNLTYADRELVTVSALAGLDGVQPQLKAHVLGARNMGLTDKQLLAIPQSLYKNVGREEALRASKAISELLGTDDEIFLKSRNCVDLKSYWPKGQPNVNYAQYFTGNSYLHPMQAGVSNVTFEPGCRNHWHIHHGAVQVLVCVYGRGWYQEWGKKAIPLIEGAVIEIPQGVKHWHGAAKNSWMQHLAYTTNVQKDAYNEWLEEVSDEQYNLLP